MILDRQEFIMYYFVPVEILIVYYLTSTWLFNYW